MKRPEELKRSERLKWSAGTGVDVWAMFCAAISGNVAEMQRLTAKDPSLVRCHYAYRTPLYFAVRENQTAAARFLLERGEDQLRLAVDDSFIQVARDRGYSEMQALLTEWLERAGGSTVENPVCTAIRDRDAARAKSLLDASPELLHASDERTNQPIHWAVMTRQLGLIDDLLARGADINAKRVDGARPIHLSNGDYFYRGWRDVPKEVTTTPAEVLAHLVARGAEVDIWTAAHMGEFEKVKEWLDRDASLANRISDYYGYYLGCGDALRNAAAKGHIEIVRLLLDRGADPNLREEEIAPNGHALYAAAYNGHYEIAQLLLEHGAYPNPEVESSADALTMAQHRNDARMVDLLCSYGAARSVEILAYYGDVQTAAAIFRVDPALAGDAGALGCAAGNGHEGFVRLMLRTEPGVARRTRGAAKSRELTELLFTHGMAANTSDWLGVSPLHDFARRGDLDNAMLFLEHGADIHARDENFASTPLGWAAKYGQFAMVELMLARGAKVEPPDEPNWARPTEWARRRGHSAIVELLEQHAGRA
jgi:ankyrin repeat protein